MIRKNLMKTLTVVMAAMLAVMTVACGATTATDTTAAITQESARDKALENTIVTVANKAGAVTSDAGKVETVYVTANANGEVGDVIVSEWLKNAETSKELKDSTQLQNIVNVKGSETYTENGDGTVTWDAKGSDIYYQGTTDKELPVKMKISYTLDGKEISPEELAGKSGKVTIRFDYENKDKQIVNVDGKDFEVYTPFAMVSGMMLDSDKFSNVEVSNGKVISDGGNIVVMGVAVPGLKESLDISDEKWEELDSEGKIEERISDHFEVTADVTDFELGMTITMASSDILSDFGMSEMTGSDKITDLKDDMGQLKDGADQLVDGSKALKDGTGELRDGVSQLYDGSQQLADGSKTLAQGTGELSNGATQVSDGSKELANGTAQLAGGSKELAGGTNQLATGSKELANGTAQLATGSKDLAGGTTQLANDSKELAGGTKELADGSKTLSSGGDSLYGGLVEYLNATKQVQEGAQALAEGAGAAKAGSDKLVAGMDQADIVNNASALATGSAQVSAGVNEVVSKLSAMSGLMTKKQEISQQYQAFSLAKAFLEGNAECSETVVQALYVLSEGKIADAATAIDIRDAGLAALQQTNGGSVNQEENGEELVINAQGGVLKAADESSEDSADTGSTDEGTDDDAGTGAGSGDEGAGAGTGEGAGAGEGSDESGNGNTGDDTDNSGSGNTGDNTDESGNGNTGDNNADGSGDTTGKDDANGSGNTDDNSTEAGNTENRESSDTIVLTKEALDAMLKEAAQKAAAEASEKTKAAILAQVEEQTKAKTAETTAMVQKIATYSGVYGAAKASVKILGETLEALNAIDFGEATLTKLQELKTGAEQGAGNSQMAEGIKTIYGGAKELNTGLGSLSAGAAKLSEGTNTLVSNNDKLTDGAGALVAGAKKISDGADALNTGAGKLSEGASQVDAGAKKLADGAGQVNTGAAKLSDGAGQVNAGAAKLSDGAGQLNDGAVKLSDGAGKVADGASKLNSGAGELSDGAKKLSDGAVELNDGVSQLNDGAIKLDDGVQELLDGMLKFDQEGIQKLYDAFDGDLTEFADRITAISEAGRDYTSFGGASKDEDSSVKFIIKTDSIKSL